MVLSARGGLCARDHGRRGPGYGRTRKEGDS
jgi:hypothetical protein